MKTTTAQQIFNDHDYKARIHQWLKGYEMQRGAIVADEIYISSGYDV
jgi:hypothetical protein